MNNDDKEIEKEIGKIATKLKELRKSKGYKSYETFAFDNNLNRVQYWRIESGQNITIKTLITVLRIHNISLSDFFKDL